MTRRGSAIRGTCALLVALACASLPDTRGYTAATIQVRQAVATTGDAVREELRGAIAAGATTADETSVQKLDAAWQATARATDAMVAYASSIEQIVDAGNKGGESAMRVALSVKTLADSLTIDPVTGASSQLLQLATETAAFLKGEYDKHRGAQSLAEALDRFGPSLQQIAVLIQAQVADERRLFSEQIEAQLQELETGSGYGDWIKAHRELDEKASAATLLLLRGIRTNSPSDIAAAKATLANVEVGQKMVAPQIAEYETKLQLLRQRERAGTRMLGAAENAIAAWGSAHLELARAVQERAPASGAPPSAARGCVAAAVVEVRSLTQRWREI